MPSLRKVALVGGLLLLTSTSVFASDQFQDAAAAFNRGDLHSAEAILHGLLRSSPNDPAALGLLGAVLDEEKKYPEAEQAYRHALELAPNSPALLNNFGNHLLTTGDAAGARRMFLKVVALRPDHPNANLQLAAMAADRKNGTDALHYLVRLPAAAQSEPQVEILRMRALYLCGRNKEADELLARLSAAAEHDPRLAFSTGLGLASVARYSAAEKFFSRTLEADPGNFDVLYNLGIAAYHAGDSQRAYDVLHTALSQRPQDVDTLYNLAVVAINLNRREEAASLLAQAARLAPSRPNVQLTLAETLSALGYYADALTAYGAYLKLTPGDSSAQREYAFMLSVCGRKDEGLPKLQAFLHSHPRDVTAYYEIAVVEALSNPADAEADLEKALALQPDFVPARFARGVLKYVQGQFAAAVPDLQFAAAQYPENATVLDRLGSAYLELNRYPDAVKVLRKAAEISPKDATVLLHLGRALSAVGEKDQARAVLQRFRAIGSDQIGHIPPAGYANLLSLPPEQLYQQYRAELQKRIDENPQDAPLNVRYLKLLLDEERMSEVPKEVAHLLEIKPPAPLAADAARALMGAEQYSEAKSLLKYASSSDAPPGVQLDLAIATFHTDGAQPALAQLDRIPESQHSGDYYLARAQILDALGKPDQALADVQQALTAAPTRPDLYQQAALFLVKERRPADAVQLLERATKALPDNRKILLLQAAMFVFARRGGEAEAVLKKIQNRWPEWAPSYLTYGIFLEGQKRSDEAKSQLETAEALGESGPQLYFYLAKATLSATPDRIDEAAKETDQALALAPADPMIQEFAGRVAYEKHDYKGAVEHLREAIRVRPNNVQAHYTLSQAYRALGQQEDAEREAKICAQLRAQNPGADDDRETPGPFFSQTPQQ